MPSDPGPALPRRRLAGPALAVAALAVAIAAAAAPVRAATVTVFAAASLTDAMTAIAEAYEARTGDTVRLSFASSATLARQIEAGAPAQVYASANERWMDYLDDRGLIVSDSRVSPIGNTLAVIAPVGDAPAVDIEAVDATGETDGSDLDIVAALGPDGRLAVGDPDHVPAGLYARQALERLGLWETLAPRLARTDDVRAALALVETGEVPLGIVYATDARVSDRVAVVATLPPGSHAPITYPFALVAGTADPAAAAFLDHLLGDAAATAFADAGFVLRGR